MKTIYLTDPVNHGGIEITEIVLRKPKGKDFKKLPIKIDSMGQILDWAAGLADQPPSVFDALAAEDVMAIMEAVSDFLPNAP